MVNIYDDILYDFQKEVVDKALQNRRYGVMLDMGLGKTLTSLAICQKRAAKRIVILVQRSSLKM